MSGRSIPDGNDRAADWQLHHLFQHVGITKTYARGAPKGRRLSRWVLELTTFAILTATGSLEVYTDFGAIVSWKVLLAAELVGAVSEAALLTEGALKSESPVTTFLR